MEHYHSYLRNSIGNALLLTNHCRNTKQGILKNLQIIENEKIRSGMEEEASSLPGSARKHYVNY